MLIQILSMLPKIKALIEKGIPFQFIQKLHSRPLENCYKHNGKCMKLFPANQFFCSLNIPCWFKKKKLLRCQTQYKQTKIFVSFIVSTGERLSTAIQIFSSFWNQRLIYLMQNFGNAFYITLLKY